MLDILVVDDESAIRVPLGDALRAQGHRVAVASDGAEAMSRLDSQVFHLVVTDVRLPKVDGFEILRRLRNESPETDVLLITAFGSIPDAVAAMKEHVVDYVTKPFDIPEMLIAVDRIDERRRLVRELADARAELATRGAEDVLVGASPKMIRLRERIVTIANSGAAVLVTGESGTGKELVARMIHDRSPRAEKSFVAVNCAAVPAPLIESELFGYERGAFTGALRRREGRFKAADGGTLFLDEIAEMPGELQSKLLRVVQEGTFEPIGTNITVQVDVRLISATNRDLKVGVAGGSFRQDLYYRLKVFELEVPPLRERIADLPLLVAQFLDEFSAKDGARAPTLQPAVWAALGRYPFPGNVRELRHAIQHATILAQGSEIGLEHLPEDIRGGGSPAATSQGAQSLLLMMERYEKELIERTLDLVGRERKKTAQLLGISRKSLWKKMTRYGLD